MQVPFRGTYFLLSDPVWSLKKHGCGQGNSVQSHKKSPAGHLRHCHLLCVCVCLKQDLFLGNRNFPPPFIVIGSCNDVRSCKGVAVKSLHRAADMKSHYIIGSPVHGYCFKIMWILKKESWKWFFHLFVWPLSLYRCTGSPLASFFHVFMSTNHAFLFWAFNFFSAEFFLALSFGYS